AGPHRVVALAAVGRVVGVDLQAAVAPAFVEAPAKLGLCVTARDRAAGPVEIRQLAAVHEQVGAAPLVDCERYLAAAGHVDGGPARAAGDGSRAADHGALWK